ncbi:MAG TPA: hypothetical protein P5346_15815 [Spirochaetota bacterium]|nr:hypothetical protein [Spirochaetota bacterium]HSA16207.1 hypothetical protein [Spirochaetota bacterium]
MTTATVHHDFKGYGAYQLSISEKMIRQRLIEGLKDLADKNETCLIKARSQGREKLVSQILSVKKLIGRIIEESETSQSGAVYRLERIQPSDEEAATDTDRDIEKLISESGGIINALTCSETDMHLADRFVDMIAKMNEIEKLLHKRQKIFKRMQVYA